MDLHPYYPLLARTPLLRGMRPDELDTLLDCFAPRVRRYARDEILLLTGYETREVGILLEGSITAVKSTPDGASVAITHMRPGGLFGDVLSGSSQKSPVTVMATTSCLALYLPYQKIIRPCAKLHSAHLQLMQNLVLTISDKYFSLSRRIDLLVMKSLRAKVAAYLLSEAARAHSLTFSIPFSRIQLADYLNCDRSALSRELSLMQRDGLLETYKSSFKLLEPDALRHMVL